MLAEEEIGLKNLLLMTPDIAKELLPTTGQWISFCQKLKLLREDRNAVVSQSLSNSNVAITNASPADSSLADGSIPGHNALTDPLLRNTVIVSKKYKQSTILIKTLEK